MASKAQKVAGVWARICPLVYFLLQLQGSQAKCYFQAQAPCRYEGKQFTLGESWLSSACLLCTCLHPVGVGCCETTQHPIDFPAWCEVHYDPQTCQISVVQKANPRLPCVNSRELEWGSAGAPEPATNTVLETRLSRVKDGPWQPLLCQRPPGNCIPALPRHWPAGPVQAATRHQGFCCGRPGPFVPYTRG